MSRIDPISRLVEASRQRERAGLDRRLRTLEPADGCYVVLDGHRLLNFSSNDYLGLARHPAVANAMRQAADQHGVGTGSAPLICGHRHVHAQLAEALADWTGRERALLFPTGYMANLGILQAVLEPGDSCIQDRLNHASLLDGARLAGCTLRRYGHADTASAERQLALVGQGGALLATDGVFSMDGDVAPLPGLAALAAAYGASMLVDDAHGLGVLGPAGAGSVAAAGLDTDQVPLLMATLGKSLGTAGAFVAGRADVIGALAESARSHVYSTAKPPALAAATLAAVGIARREDWRREHLAALVTRFRTGASQLGLPLAASTSPIQPLMLGASDRALALAEALRERGVLAVAIRPPTVPAGRARLRLSFSAAHGPADVDLLLDALEALAPVWR